MLISDEPHPRRSYAFRKVLSRAELSQPTGTANGAKTSYQGYRADGMQCHASVALAISVQRHKRPIENAEAYGSKNGQTDCI